MSSRSSRTSVPLAVATAALALLAGCAHGGSPTARASASQANTPGPQTTAADPNRAPATRPAAANTTPTGPPAPTTSTARPTQHPLTISPTPRSNPNTIAPAGSARPKGSRPAHGLLAGLRDKLCAPGHRQPTRPAARHSLEKLCALTRYVKPQS